MDLLPVVSVGLYFLSGLAAGLALGYTLFYRQEGQNDGFNDLSESKQAGWEAAASNKLRTTRASDGMDSRDTIRSAVATQVALTCSNERRLCSAKLSGS